MTEILDALRLVGGFVYLLVGGDFLVRGALGLSKRMEISPVLVGLTIVAFGTSAPELLVSLYAGFQGFPGVVIGNIVGSNIANVLLVLGLPALIHPIHSDDPALGQQACVMLGVSALLVAMGYTGSIDWLEGIVLLAAFAVGAFLTVSGYAQAPGLDLGDAEEQLTRVLGLPHSPASIAALTLAGCVMLPVGADLAVDGAVALARTFGLSEVVIGATIIALGTSLPELSTTMIAAFHRTSDIALGNVIGSNVFNVLLILGLTAALFPIPIPQSVIGFDLWVMLIAAALLTWLVVRKQSLGRVWGTCFIAGYVLYIVGVL